MDVTLEQMTSLGFKIDLPGVGPVEVVWNQPAGILAVQRVPDAAAALLLVGRLVGQGLTIAGFVAGGGSPPQVAPPAHPPQPQQPQLSLVPPPVTTTTPAQTTAAAAAPPPQQQAPAQPAPPQPKSGPLPEDAVFARASTLTEVVEEIVRRLGEAGVPQGTDAEALVVQQAKAIRARGAAPALAGIPDEEIDGEIVVAAMAPLICAGLK